MSAQYQPPNYDQAAIVSKIIDRYLQMQEHHEVMQGLPPKYFVPLSATEKELAGRAKSFLELIKPTGQ